MVKAVLFDVDGTLIDSNDLHAAAWQEAFRHFGFDFSFETVRSQIGKGGDNLVPSLLPEETVDEKQEEIEAFRSELFQRRYLPRAVPFPGVRQLFERLAADGIAIVLASSAKKEELEFNIGLMGAGDLISASTSADDVENSKPDPDIFQAAIKAAGVDRNDAVVVGDTPWDVMAACKAGLRTIGFRSGGFPDDALSDAGAVELYDGPADLLRNYEESLLNLRK